MRNATSKKNHTEYVSEKAIAELLGVKPRTIQVYVCRGRIPEAAIKRSKVNGARTYHVPTIIGLNEN